MLPEKILQSDVLDILFENMNKEYGAYELRRFYHNRLYKAMGVTILLSLMFVALNSIRFSNHIAVSTDNNIDSVMLKTVEVSIKKDDPVKPKDVIPKTVNHNRTAAPQIIFNTPIITTGNKVKDTIASIATLKESIISNITTTGVPGGETLPVKGNTTGNTLGNTTTATTEVVEETSPIANPEVMPEFPGGEGALARFMNRNLRQPEDMEAGEKFVVVVQFIVDKTGNIADINIIQSARRDMDEEVTRVVKKMPKWKPGYQHNRAVPVYFNLPINFIASGY